MSATNLQTRLYSARVAAFVFALLTGCPLGVKAQYQIALPETIALQRDVRYSEGKGESWKADLLFAKEQWNKLRPAIFFLHGGGWMAGHKTDQLSYSVHFVKLGFLCMMVSYRLSSEAPFPAAIEDCKCAVRWLRAHA